MTQSEDLIAKLILQGALEDSGQVSIEQEIPMLDGQSADLCYTPGPGPRNQAPAFVLINQMTRDPCTLEPCSRTPSRTVLARGCFRKQFQHFHNDCLDAEHRHAGGEGADWDLHRFGALESLVDPGRHRRQGC